jgi:putative acetyltransferase
LADFCAERCPFVRGRSGIPTVEQEAAFIRRFLDSPPSMLLVARAEERIVGMLDFCCRPHPQESHAGELGMSVLQPFRRRGIGRALLTALFERLRAFPQVRRVELEVFATNQGAIQLYQSCGFRHEGCRERAVRVDAAFVDVFLMARHTEPNQ